MDVLHRCDNPACVNPDHLFVGTALDNINDMKRKGRRRWIGPSGEANGNAKLGSGQVKEIRRRRSSGEPGKSIARDFGITPTHVYDLTNRKAWRHV
jgi:hypothetical protein